MTTPATPAPLPALPEPTIETFEATFTFPHILQSAGEQSGFDMLSVRIGGPRQVQWTVETGFSDTLVPEPDKYQVKGTNQINFAGNLIDVLNDAVTYNGKSLVASSPTASEYMAMVGKPVVTQWKCQRAGPAVAAAVGRQVVYVTKKVSITLL